MYTPPRKEGPSGKPSTSPTSRPYQPTHSSGTTIPGLMLAAFCAFCYVIYMVRPDNDAADVMLTSAGDRKPGAAPVLEERERLVLTDEEWRKRLSEEAFNVLRRAGTEPRWASPLLKEKRSGVYSCKGCGRSLFSSDFKYDSGSGWPSFFQTLPGAVLEAPETDGPVGLPPRVEVTCSKCGGHLGHVFDDGPAPTNKRYCMNGVALSFSPEDDQETKA